MTLLARRSRLLTFLVALVQLSLPGALEVIDATRARNGIDAVAHVEEAAGRQCPPAHSDECVICQYLSMGATRPDPAPGVLPSGACARPAVPAEAYPHSIAHRGLHSRAPPETVG